MQNHVGYTARRGRGAGARNAWLAAGATLLAAGVLAVATSAARPTAVAKDGQQKSQTQTTCFFGPDGPPLSYPLDLVTT